MAARIEKIISIRGIQLRIVSFRQDRRGKNLYDAISVEDGHVWGTGHSSGQAIARARKKLS